MPGPVSDSYDPEFSTSENCDKIIRTLRPMYDILSALLHNSKPIYILDLIDEDLPEKSTLTLSEKQWRLIRFALERAIDSI